MVEKELIFSFNLWPRRDYPEKAVGTSLTTTRISPIRAFILPNTFKIFTFLKFFSGHEPCLCGIVYNSKDLFKVINVLWTI